MTHSIGYFDVVKIFVFTNAVKWIRRRNTAEEKRLMEKKQRQRKAMIKKATKVDLEKKLLDKKLGSNLNRRLASTLEA